MTINFMITIDRYFTSKITTFILYQQYTSSLSLRKTTANTNHRQLNQVHPIQDTVSSVDQEANELPPWIIGIENENAVESSQCVESGGED